MARGGRQGVRQDPRQVRGVAPEDRRRVQAVPGHRIQQHPGHRPVRHRRSRRRPAPGVRRAPAAGRGRPARAARRQGGGAVGLRRQAARRRQGPHGRQDLRCAVRLPDASGLLQQEAVRRQRHPAPRHLGRDDQGGRQAEGRRDHAVRGRGRARRDLDAADRPRDLRQRPLWQHPVPRRAAERRQEVHRPRLHGLDQAAQGPGALLPEGRGGRQDPRRPGVVRHRQGRDVSHGQLRPGARARGRPEPGDRRVPGAAAARLPGDHARHAGLGRRLVRRQRQVGPPGRGTRTGQVDGDAGVRAALRERAQATVRGSRGHAVRPAAGRVGEELRRQRRAVHAARRLPVRPAER